jgi:hypothetical protein
MKTRMTCKLRVDGDVNEDDNYWETYSRFHTEGYEAAGKGVIGDTRHCVSQHVPKENLRFSFNLSLLQGGVIGEPWFPYYSTRF